MKKKPCFNQYFTPRIIAEYMANLLNDIKINSEISILDPGAGKGILCTSLIEFLLSNYKEIKKINCVCYEIDSLIIEQLKKNIDNQINKNHNINIRFEIRNQNFVTCYNESEKFDVVITNPPYEKINSKSVISTYLKEKNINTVNYYSVFIEIALSLLKEKGQLIAIVPRSFTNGKYFSDFRKSVIKNSNLILLHSFKSRNLFKNVLQEFVIVKLSKKQCDHLEEVKVRISEETNPFNYHELLIERNTMIDKANENVIRIFNSYNEVNLAKMIERNGIHLKELELTVSTGPLVDFRDAKNKLYSENKDNVIPCIFNEHMKQSQLKVDWPLEKNRKGNYVTSDISASKIKPSANYVIMKRISPNKKQKRFFANLITNKDFKENITFDNKINYFHADNGNMKETLALGLCLYLNTSMVEVCLKQIVGNTQLNCSDLKSLKYPNKEILNNIGVRWKRSNLEFNSYNIDKIVFIELTDWT